jgi:hypothetical protein
MLTLEPPYFSINGIIVFRDHASPTTFYYLAGPPKLSKRPDGKPDFALLKYREALDSAANVTPAQKEQLGGGFLIFGVDCALSDTVLGEIKGEISSYAPSGDIQLVPVLYTSGTVKVVALDYQSAAGTDPAKASRFVRGVIGTATPSLLQDERAIFSVALDPDAVSLLEAAYEDDLSPIGVMYELQFTGLRPALSVKATVDYKRVYEYFKTHLSVGIHTGSGKNTVDDSNNKTVPPPTTTPPTTPPATTPQVPPNITVTITVPGALGTMKYKTRVASANADSAETVSRAGAVPVTGSSTSITFPAATAATGYAVGSCTITFTATAFAISAWTPAGTNPAITQTTANFPPPAANAGTTPPPTGTPSTLTTTNQNLDQSQSTSQFGFDADITYAMEKLRQEEALKIDIVRMADGQSIDTLQNAAMDLLKTTILQGFFTPVLTAPSTAAAMPTAPTQNGAVNSAPTPATINRPATGATGSGDSKNSSTATSSASTTRVDIGFQLNYMTEDELRTATFDFTFASPETRLHAPCGFFALLLKGTSRDDLIRDISLDDPFFTTFNTQISTVADWVPIDLKSIVVDAQYGGTDAAPKVTQSYSLTPADAAPKSFEAYIDNFDLSWRSSIQYTFGVDDTTASQKSSYRTPWVRSGSRALVVAPQNDVPMLRIYVEPGVIDWDLVGHVETTLTYDDPGSAFHAERTFMISSDSHRQSWVVRLSNPALDTYMVRHTWFLKEGRQITGTAAPSRAPQLFVPDPFVDRVPVTVQALVDPNSVARVTVAFDYTDKPNNFQVHKSIDLVGPAFHPVTLAIPLVDAKKRTYTYTATIIGTNGNKEQRPAADSTALSLDITDGSTVVDVQVTMLGDLAAAHASGIQVDLQAAPPDGQQPVVQSHLFEVGGDRKWTQRLLLRSDRPSRTFQYRTTVFADGKDPAPTDWIDCETPVLPLMATRLVAGT